MIAKLIIITTLNLILFGSSFAQISNSKPYSSWRLGNKHDYKLPDESVLNGGIVLAGGSADQDTAMRWFLRKAMGGDVLIFRNAKNNSLASEYPTADAYNGYFYNELGVDINSAETILFNSRDVANNAEVYEKVKKAEAIFFTGGDQSFYYLFTRGTLLQDALNYFINVKHGVIGGTSAGTAIQGDYVFSAEYDTIVSTNALNNPFDKQMTLRNEFLKHKLLRNTITDSHFHNRDREGRLIAFMARMVIANQADSALINILAKGIGVDEKTAVCIESNGRAYVFGLGDAYFMIQNSLQDTPEQCSPNKVLDWYRNRKAVRVYKVSGTSEGKGYLDLGDWSSGNLGSWYYYYVDKGRMFIDETKLSYSKFL